jgi:hypothetical protein
MRREFSKFSSLVQEALITSAQRMIHASGDYSRPPFRAGGLETQRRPPIGSVSDAARKEEA